MVDGNARHGQRGQYSGLRVPSESLVIPIAFPRRALNHLQRSCVVHVSITCLTHLHEDARSYARFPESYCEAYQDEDWPHVLQDSRDYALSHRRYSSRTNVHRCPCDQDDFSKVLKNLRYPGLQLPKSTGIPINWKTYGPSGRSCQPVHHFTNAQELLLNFDGRYPSRPRGNST